MLSTTGRLTFCVQRFTKRLGLFSFNKIHEKDNVRYVYNERALSLAFARFKKIDKSSTEPPVLILHGMLGSKRNWLTFCRNFNEETGREVIAVDCRNHGESEHSSEMSYDFMSHDIEKTLKQLNIPKTILIGHSMGGKLAMNMALSMPQYIEKLIVVDVSPSSTDSRHVEFHYTIQAMLDVASAQVQSRKEADNILAKTIPSAEFRGFLLTSLKRCVYQNSLIWQLNVTGICDNVANLTEAVTLDGREKFEGETLFVGGRNSTYLSAGDLANIKTMFPKAYLEMIPDAGHLVHIDKPKELLTLINKFLSA